MERLSNDENIQNLLLRKRLRTAIISCGICTLVLASLDLYFQKWYLLVGALLFFIASAILTKKRENVGINKSTELMEIEDAVRKNKNKFGRK